MPDVTNNRDSHNAVSNPCPDMRKAPKYTKNFKLRQFEASDIFTVEAINENNRRIDKALTTVLFIQAVISSSTVIACAAMILAFLS